MPGRTLAIGDIHGCARALESVLAAARLVASDTLVILGDVVDRGPDSCRTVELLLDLRRFCNLVTIKGNHEEMMLSALAGGEWSSSWGAFGGAQTVASYNRLGGIPQTHLEYLNSGAPYFQRGAEIFTHANLEPQVPLEQQSAEWLRWTHLTGFERPRDDGARVIVGHTPQVCGLPMVMPGWVAIDTFAHGPGGWLTCLEVDSNRFWQANQAGLTREGVL